MTLSGFGFRGDFLSAVASGELFLSYKRVSWRKRDKRVVFCSVTEELLSPPFHYSAFDPGGKMGGCYLVFNIPGVHILYQSYSQGILAERMLLKK